MQYVTVVNRTSKDLEALWDGRRYYLKPGRNSLPDVIARIAKRQNPRMGTENPFLADMCESLLGVEEWNDDCSPLEQSTAIERLDRSQMSEEAQKAQTMRGATGVYTGPGGRNAVSRDQPLDSSFVKP